jgi:general secretion pathway protein G
MKCPNCDFENADEIRVCINCGADFIDQSVGRASDEGQGQSSPPSSDPPGPSSPPHEASTIGFQHPKTDKMPPINSQQQPPANLPNGTLYIILGIIETFCCCQLFGLLGLILALVGKSAERNNNYDKARTYYKASIIILLLNFLFTFMVIIIFALIAVPNFLEAQTRSKVSRTRSDMRTMATALEAFRVDYNSFVPYTDDPQSAIALDPSVTPSTPTFVAVSDMTYGYSLTTPIAYISRYYEDVFNPGRPLCYITKNNHWLVYSPGPDGIFDLTSKDYLSHVYGQNSDMDWILPFTYDPTNGTVSGGDIWRVSY